MSGSTESQEDHIVRIGELSRRTGVSPRLLRYYEEQGLLTADRAGGTHRRYTDDAPDTVRRIRTLLAAGLPTSVIREILPCARDDGYFFDTCPERLDRVRAQLADLDAHLDAVQQTRAALAAFLDTVTPRAGAPAR